MDQVEEIKSKVDIVSLISGYIALKKAGKNYKANCPFHSEKTPSFMVSPELQTYKCFGCGESGDVFSFLEKYDGMEFFEALQMLSEKTGVKLIRGNYPERDIKKILFQINHDALRFYNYVLTSHPQGSAALKYFREQRGLKTETIKEFQLGFSPNKPYALFDYLTKRKKYQAKDIEDTGLFYRKDNRLFDRFRGRVVFPLMDHRGNVSGFAGRIMPVDEGRDLAKYVNTPETIIYHKSKLLFPLNITKTYIKEKGEAILVEGELDAITLWQANFKNVVAIKGSALTDDQIRLTKRFCQRIIFALDSDTAGGEASKRGISLAEKDGLETKVAIISGYKDPDEMVRKDPEMFEQVVKKSVSSWDYLVNSVFNRHDQDTSSGRSSIAKEIVTVLNLINDDILKAHYINIVSQKLNVPYGAVESQTNKVTQENNLSPKHSETEKNFDNQKTRRELLEERFLAVAFQTGSEKKIKKSYSDLFSTPLASKILLSYLKYPKDSKFSVKNFRKTLGAELIEGFVNIILKQLNDVVYGNPQKAEEELKLIIDELRTLDLKEKLIALQKKITQHEKTGESEELRDLEKEFSKISGELKALEEEGRKSIILH